MAGIPLLDVRSWSCISNGGQLAPLQPPSAQAFEASELERKSKERDRAKRGRDAKKEAHAAALEEADGLRTENASLRKLRPPSLS